MSAGSQAEAGGQSKLLAALAYFFPFIGPAVALVVGKGDKFARFHAWQAGIYDAILVIGWILGMFIDFFFWIFYLIAGVLGVLAFIAFIMVLMGKTFKIPLIGQIADRLSG